MELALAPALPGRSGPSCSAEPGVRPRPPARAAPAATLCFFPILYINASFEGFLQAGSLTDKVSLQVCVRLTHALQTASATAGGVRRISPLGVAMGWTGMEPLSPPVAGSWEINGKVVEKPFIIISPPTFPA